MSDDGWASEKTGILLSEKDIITLTQEVGEQRYPIFGGRAFRELAELVLLRPYPVVKSDFGQFRGTKHVLFYWHQSFWKSSIMEAFFGIGKWEGKGVIDNEGLNIIAPRSFTPERFRGSVVRDRSDVKFLMPYPAVADVICIDELLSFIGTGEGRSKMLALLNSIMESGMGSVDLVKMGDLDISDIPSEHRENFQITETGIYYRAQSSFVAASHYLHPKTEETLQSYGHLSRYDIVAVPFGKTTNFEMLKRFLLQSKYVDDDFVEKVRACWTLVQQIRVDELTAPSRELILEVINEVQKREEKAVKGGVQFFKPGLYADGRFISRVARKLIARAIAMLPRRNGVLDFEFSRLKYEANDAKVIADDVFRTYTDMSIAFTEPEEIEMNLNYIYGEQEKQPHNERVEAVARICGLPSELVSTYVVEG